MLKRGKNGSVEAADGNHQGTRVLQEIVLFRVSGSSYRVVYYGSRGDFSRTAQPPGRITGASQANQGN